MAYGTQDFPFNIADVAALLNLRVRHRQARSMDVDCPYCSHKKGKMNINFEKNVFRCNYCGEYGGMTAMYAKVYGISNADAYREICEALRTGVETPKYEARKKEMEKPSVPNSPLANAEEIHQTYSMLLASLSLSATHKENLLSRGLTETQIEHFGFKSTPAFGFVGLTARLQEQGCTIQGVPGFYIDGNGQWTVKFHSKCSGFLVPVMSMDGRIQGLQIRLDRPFNNRKYLWMSSVNEQMGASSGSPVHFVGDPAAKVIYVTEGSLKADIAHCLCGRTFVAVAGANQYTNLKALFATLRHNGVKEIIEAYDMDKFGNEHVEKGSMQLFRLANEFGFTAHRLKWDPKYKGIDDWQLALSQAAPATTKKGGIL